MSTIASSHSFEELPLGWRHATVTYEDRHGKDKTTYQVIDTRPAIPLQYNNDPMRTIAIKCAILVAGLPFIAIANIAFTCVRVPVLILNLLGRPILSFLGEPSVKNLDRIFIHWTYEAPMALIEGIAHVVKTPFMMLEMQLCCLYGIVSPLEGRILAGNAERVWKGGVRSDDIRHAKNGDVVFKDLFTNHQSKYCFFIAYCFQPIGPAVEGGRVKKIKFLSY